MKKNGSQNSESSSQLIDARIEELGDWRGEMLSRLRSLVKEADPEIVEEWKWRGVPVWYHDGMICTGETYKNVVKMTFAKGAALQDPSAQHPWQKSPSQRSYTSLPYKSSHRDTTPEPLATSTPQPPQAQPV